MDEEMGVKEWLWTGALITFVATALYGKLEWSPALTPSAILIWYGLVRGASYKHDSQE